MPVSVDDLLSNPFRTRRNEEKLQIVLEGRPCPFLSSVINGYKEKKEYSNHLRTVQYELIPWLTACEKRMKLFCWPCLLFINEKGAWNYSGFRDLTHFNSSIQKHERSISHVQAVMDLHMFTKQIKVPVIRKRIDQLEIAKHNDTVQRNRDILKRIVDVFCYLVAKQQPTSNKMERCCHPMVDDCVELLQLIQNYDIPCITYIDDAIASLRKSPSFFADMILALRNVLKQAIKQEIQGTLYVSIVLSETSDISTKSQISTILRYVKDGKIYERFVGFTNVVEYRSSNVLFRHIAKIVDDFQIEEKLVGQAYNGAITSSSQLKDLIAKVQSAYPYAVFVPCYFHEFERVLQQSLAPIKECEIFFKTLNGITIYFSENPKRLSALEHFMTEKKQGMIDYEYSLKNQTAGVVRNYRKKFVEFFEFVIKNSEKWETDDVIKARGFIEFLQELQTIFLLEIFSKVFSYTEFMGKALRSETPECAFSTRKVNEIKRCLLDDKEYGYEIIWATVVAESLNYDVSKPKRLKLELDRESKLQYRELFHKIVDYLLQQIDFRCSPLPKLDFFQLLNCENYLKSYHKFPDIQVEKLFVEYIGLFDNSRLTNELRVLFSHAAFNDKKIHELLEFLVQEKLTSNFREIAKLAQLILTLPTKTAQVNCASSTMTSYADWCYISENNDATRNDLSFLSVEKTLLAKIKRDDSFYENVVNEFAKQSNYVELMYK